MLVGFDYTCCYQIVRMTVFACVVRIHAHGQSSAQRNNFSIRSDFGVRLRQQNEVPFQHFVEVNVKQSLAHNCRSIFTMFRNSAAGAHQCPKYSRTMQTGARRFQCYATRLRHIATLPISNTSTSNPYALSEGTTVGGSATKVAITAQLAVIGAVT